MNSIKLSVVVPLYNAEKTVERLLTTLLNQEVDFDYEIVLLNDGSVDQTENLVQQFMQDYKGKVQLSYYSHENCGVSKTRNRGVQLAKGEYITFVDSDDFLEPDALKVLMSVQGDYVISPVTSFEGTVKQEREFSSDLFGTFETTPDTFERILQASILNSPCAKIYRKSVLIDKNITFNEHLSLGEDLIFNIHYFFSQKYVTVIPQSVYIYDTSQSTLTRQKRDDYFNVRKTSWEALKSAYETYQLDMTIFNWLYVKMIYAYCFQLFENKIFQYKEDSKELKRILSLDETQQVLKNMQPEGKYQALLLGILKTQNVPFIFACSKIFAGLRKKAPKQLTNVSV